MEVLKWPRIGLVSFGVALATTPMGGELPLWLIVAAAVTGVGVIRLLSIVGKTHPALHERGGS
jgi:hypothetical protein